MWLMLELPDECQDAVDELIAWHSKPEHMASSISPAAVISWQGEVKLAARVMDIQTQ